MHSGSLTYCKDLKQILSQSPSISDLRHVNRFLAFPQLFCRVQQQKHSTYTLHYLLIYLQPTWLLITTTGSRSIEPYFLTLSGLALQLMDLNTSFLELQGIDKQSTGNNNLLFGQPQSSFPSTRTSSQLVVLWHSSTRYAWCSAIVLLLL